MADGWGAIKDATASVSSDSGMNNDSFAADNAFGAGDSFGGGPDPPQGDEPGRIQEDKVNKKRLAELELDGKTLQIFTRPSPKSGLIPFTLVKDIPLQVATICSNLFFEKFVKKDQKYYIIHDSNLAPWKFVLEWIKACAEERGVANIIELNDLVTDESNIQPVIDIMVVAQKLKIPTASFNKFIVKKLLPLARSHLITLDNVKLIFDSGSDVYDLNLQEVAAVSIFNHWYEYKLDAEEFDDYMEELGEMRRCMPELDDALHKAVEEKDCWLKGKRAERAAKAAEEAIGHGDGGGSGEGWVSTTDDGGFGAVTPPDNSLDGGDAGGGAAQGAGTSGGEWDKGAKDIKIATAGGDWADEVINGSNHIPTVVASGGW